MSTIEIKRFDSNNLEKLAKEQTTIYNQGIENLIDYPPATVQDVINLIWLVMLV